jgi:hypothetical protein
LGEQGRKGPAACRRCACALATPPLLEATTSGFFFCGAFAAPLLPGVAATSWRPRQSSRHTHSSCGSSTRALCVARTKYPFCQALCRCSRARAFPDRPEHIRIFSVLFSLCVPVCAIVERACALIRRVDDVRVPRGRGVSCLPSVPTAVPVCLRTVNNDVGQGRGKKFGTALLQTRVFAAPHKKEDRPHPQQQ